MSKKMKLALYLTALGLILLPALRAQDKEDEDIIREYDEILVKGATNRLSGTVVQETETTYHFQPRDYPDMITPIPKEIVAEYKPRTTPQQAFRIKRSKVGAKNYKACYKASQWSLRYRELREKTKEALRDCIKMKPDFLDAYLLLSDLIREEYQTSEGASEEQLNHEIELYRHAIDSGVTDPRIHYRLGLAVRKADLPHVALRFFESAIKRNEIDEIPEITTWSLQESGEILVEMGKPDEALKRFEKVLALDSGDFRSLLGKGEAKLLLGELDEAAGYFVQAAAVDASFPRTYTLLGSVAYLKGELFDAEVSLETARQVGLPDAANLTALGMTHARMGKYQSAAVELSEALLCDPNHWQAHLARGYLAENRGSFNDAIKAYQSALQLDPPDAGLAHYKLAYCYYQLGDKGVAAAELNAALKNGMSSPEVFKFLGRIEFEEEKWNTAARYFRHAAIADESDADAHCLLATSYLKLKRKSDATQHYLKALEHNPAHTGALNGLGYLAYNSGNFSEATRRFNAADRSDSYAQEALAKLVQVLRWNLWEDNFERPDSDEISNGWNEENDVRFGIEMRIGSNCARFSGKQREAWQKIFLSRTEPKSKFRRIEADINGLQAGGAQYGLRIESRNAKGETTGVLILIKDLYGFLSYNYTLDRGKWKDPENAIQIQQFPLDTSAHKLGISVLDERAGIFELMFDGRKLVQVTCPPLVRARELIIGVYGEADAGVPWTLDVETVRIFKQKRQATKKSGSGF